MMPGSIVPRLHFRVRENGAQVFRVSRDSRQNRLDMQPIAVINLRKAEIRPHGDQDLSEEELTAMREWIAARRQILARREIEDLWRLVDQLHMVTNWVQSRASDEDLAALDDALLIAMHDLRAALVRRRAERATGDDADQEPT